MPDPGSGLRVSDEQRDRAAQEIREHYAAGRLTDDELIRRVQAAYRRPTEDELQGCVADLPALPPSPPAAQRRARRTSRSSCSGA